MPENIFDARIAARYDEADRAMFADDIVLPAVEFLADLANGGRALEFAVGTGRIAIPLQQHGVQVDGVELSRPMLEAMNAKPGAAKIHTTVGDMASVDMGRKYSLVYLVYNTITNLITQDEQVACFCNAAAHLETGGSFVIEVQTPSLQKLPKGERLLAFDASPEHIGIDEYDIVQQTVISHHYWTNNVTSSNVSAGSGVGENAVEVNVQADRFNSTHRYAWPPEYDLMARIAGMSLSQRWANWQRDPFTSESAAHVSVWTKVA